MIMHWSSKLNFVLATALIPALLVAAEPSTKADQETTIPTAVIQQTPPPSEPIKPDPKPQPSTVASTSVQAPPIRIDKPASKKVSAPAVKNEQQKSAVPVQKTENLIPSDNNNNQQSRLSLLSMWSKFNLPAWLTKHVAGTVTGVAGTLGSLAILVPNLHSAVTAPQYKDGEENPRKKYILKATAAAALGVASVALLLYSYNAPAVTTCCSHC